jgi:hypothetical protein
MPSVWASWSEEDAVTETTKTNGQACRGVSRGIAEAWYRYAGSKSCDTKQYALPRWFEHILTSSGEGDA